MTISAAEQYFIEMTNRARLDPEAEADRLGIDLNQGLSAGTLDGTAKQVLAPNDILHDAAEGHSLWMLSANKFSHTGSGGSSAGQRMQNEGYSFYGSWTWGENISWRGTSGTINLESAITSHFDGLFRSSGHRKNTLNDSFREFGIAQEAGTFLSDGRNWSASMLTTKFAKTGSEVFVTGVAYDDDVTNDDFYTMGEGLGGMTFSAGGASDTTASAGGYAVGVGSSGPTTVTINGAGVNASVIVDLSSGNVKLDVVDGEWAFVSYHTTLVSGLDKARALGVDEIDLTGNGAGNHLIGNDSNNRLDGAGGNDTLDGAHGSDNLQGGDGDDLLLGGKGRDGLWAGDGDDTAEGGNGRDVLGGSAGNDVLRGGNGHDMIYGGADNDRVVGQGGNDTLLGGSGNDKLFGGGGNDRLEAGAGNDQLTGAGGSDVFVFASGDGDNNRITDFNTDDDNEKIDLTGVFDNANATLVRQQYTELHNDGVLITDFDGFSVLLEGVSVFDLSDADLIV